MEGLNVTFPQTKTILEGVNVPSLKIDEIQCILNLRDAWKYIINNINTLNLEINDFSFNHRKYCSVRHSSYLAWDRVHPNQIGATLIALEWLKHCELERLHTEDYK